LSFAAVLVGGAGLAGAGVLVLLLLLGRLLRGLQSGLFLKNLLNRIRNLKTKPKIKKTKQFGILVITIEETIK
jgi:hypothetical protein